MKTTFMLLLMTTAFARPPAEGGVPMNGQEARRDMMIIQLVSARGDVAVRHGASDRWVAAAPGDVLKPEDSIRLRDGAAASLDAGGRNIALSGRVILDIADLRTMTRGDLLLKLAMEDVRSVPRPDPKLGNPGVAKTTTTRAGDRDGAPQRPTAGGEWNMLRLGGTKVLYDYGYYGTCVLRSREIFRVEPALALQIDARLRVADALERMNLREEAYDAYAALAPEALSAAEKRMVEKKLEALKK